MTRALRRDHADIHTLRRRDGAEVDVEAVREHQGLAWRQVRGNLGLVERLLDVIWHQNHDHVRLLHGIRNGGHTQPLGLGLGAALAAFVQADNDIDAGVTQVEGMSMALAPVANHGHSLAK